ncbi:abscisic acid-deficient protein Aba4 family protein [Taklimakanibacter deserti]|uniref:abscisic acid-deficient protein Aba4 family protein n=1 Tax=Taklimakanibacter deserti TaxID=2267839 RepID=UPI0013C4DF2F
MTPEGIFTAANFTAMAGWAVLAIGVVFNNALLRDLIAGRVVPALLAALYTALILLHWAGSQGGFGSLADVASLFANPWLLLAGWVHYLAFDLAIGSAIARKTFDEGLPRLALVPILPLTFLFGPIGWLCFEALRLIAPLLQRKAPA